MDISRTVSLVGLQECGYPGCQHQRKKTKGLERDYETRIVENWGHRQWETKDLKGRHSFILDIKTDISITRSEKNTRNISIYIYHEIK